MPIDGTVFDMFVYKPWMKQQWTPRIRRATAQTIQWEEARIKAFAQDINLQIDLIQRDLMATQYARRPKGTPIEIMSDPTNNQSAELE